MIVEDVRIMRERYGRTTIILHHRFLFNYGLPHIIIINDIINWLLNTNSIKKLILMNVKGRIENM